MDNARVTLRSVLIVGQSATAHPSTAPLRALCEEILLAGDLAGACEILIQAKPELVILSEGLSEPDALACLAHFQAQHPALPVVVVSAHPEVDKAVRFVRSGAADFIEAPLVGDRLERLFAVASAAGTGPGRRDPYFSSACPAGVPLVGHSPAMAQALGNLHLVAASNCNPILILGETGTGKELAAQAVHSLRCSSGPFVAVNCAALSANRLESELFGHVKGAFTSADHDKIGLFEVATGGSLFLDEISEIPLELQSKLLRVLQERTFRKVGGTKDIRCHATVIASSNRDLAVEARQGRFRKDLYYRLAVFPVTMSALRDPQRRSDIPVLANYFLETSAIAGAAGKGRVRSLTKTALEMLSSHDWPGNVRELRNAIERALILERSNAITPASLIIERQQQPESAIVEASAAKMDFSLASAEREFILRALKETGWQRTRAAALLGISRATLHAKLKSYDIKAPAGSAAGSPPVGEADASPGKMQESWL